MRPSALTEAEAVRRALARAALAQIAQGAADVARLDASREAFLEGR